ncbi:ABC transporter permease [Streptomyces phaeochromogenes]
MSAPPAAPPRRTPTRTTASGSLSGVPQLIRLILRRDRIWLPLWLLMTFGTVTSRANARETTFPDTEAVRDRYNEVMNDVPMFKLFQGPAYGMDVNALVAQEAIGGATLIAALGAVIFVVRHTRSEEQAGRSELVSSTAVGRHAQLAAALAVVLGSGVLLAVFSAAGMAGAGMPGTGSFAFGLVVMGAVWIAAGLAAVAAQLTENARAATIGAFAVFFGLHFARGAADMGDGFARGLGWLVPNAWLQRSRPFADERWWPFLLVALLVGVLLWAATRLASHRDLGAGVMSTRSGPVTAAPGLRSAGALTWRLQRGMAAVWLVAVIAVSLPTGFVGADAMEQYSDSEQFREWADAMGANNTGEAFFAYIAFTMCFPITIYALMTLLRLSGEESGGHAELLLSFPVSRIRWAAGHLLIALAMPTLLLVAVGVCFGIGSDDLGDMMSTTTSLIPAVWVMVGIAMAAYGLLGRAGVIVGWGALVVAVAVEFGQHVGLPEWTFKAFSPFAHVVPFYGAPSALTLGTLTLVAVALVAVGLAGVRRRNLPA